MADRSPAFQFYPKDFLSDVNVLRMDMTARGVYITLLAVCWLERSIPNDLDAVASIVHISPDLLSESWGLISGCFIERSGRLIHGRLELERKKQRQFSKRQRLNAEKKWMPRHQSGNATEMPRQCSSSSSSSSSSIQDLRAHEPAPIARTTAGPDLERRAGMLVERYGQLFYEHRKGAKYRSKPNLDWHDALTLVPLWDDHRLEKLAILVLTTDDEWIEKTDRGFHVFAIKASWADDRLRAWEIANKVTA